VERLEDRELLNYTPLSSLSLAGPPSTHVDLSSARLGPMAPAIGGLTALPSGNWNPEAGFRSEPLGSWDQPWLAQPANYSMGGDLAGSSWQPFGFTVRTYGLPTEQSPTDLPQELYGSESFPGRFELVRIIAVRDVSWRADLGVGYPDTTLEVAPIPFKSVQQPIPSPYRNPTGDQGFQYQAPVYVHSEESSSSALLSAPSPSAPAAGIASLANQGRQATQAAAFSASSVVSGPAASFTALAVTELRAAGTRFVALPILFVAGSLKPDTPVNSGNNAAAAPRPTNPVIEPSPYSPGQAASDDKTPAAEAGGGANAPSPPRPEAAGLITQALTSGLTTLERAIQSLLEPEPEADASGAALLYWVGASFGLAASVVGYQMIQHRRASRPSVRRSTESSAEPRLFREGLS
jgi:hypothetical protein